MPATIPDITAHPAEQSGRALTPETIAGAASAFAASGSIVLRDVFDRALIEKVRDHFVQTYRRDYEDPQRRRVERVGDKRNLLVVEVEGMMNDPELYAGPLVHPVLKRLLGDDCIVGQYGSVTSLPGAADQRPHRDSPWLFGDPALDVAIPCYAITVIIPLVDMHVERTGTTRVWPGTHRVSSDDEAARMPSADPVVPAGSCMLMDSRVRHGGTGNLSTTPRPILYMSYQRRWFRDYDGYDVKPPVHVSKRELGRVPAEHRHLFAWALPDNTPETIDRALKRAIKWAVPAPVKAILRRLRA